MTQCCMSDEFESRVVACRDFVLSRRLLQPRVALILGSGLGSLVDHVSHPTCIPYAQLPHFSTTHAEGHAGQLVLGFLAGVPIVLMQGRAHRYEGLANWQAAFPVHCMHALGADTLITTNAAGGLNVRFQTGDLMAIDSHIDLLWPRGMFCNQRMLREELGGFQPSRTPVYDRRLLAQASQAACRRGLRLHQGCYLSTLGPTYETRSEYRMFRWTGADAVGMSTVPEVLAAQTLGMRTLAFSVITNVASTDTPQSTSHAEVVDSGIEAGPRLLTIVEDILQDLAGQPD